MRKSTSSELIAIQSPLALKADFMKALAAAADVHSIELGVPKNFTGDGYATQELPIGGLKTVDFELMANGEKQFPQGEHFMLGSLRVYTGVEATISLTDWIAGVNDATLKQAKIDIIINGTVEWRDIPMLVFTRSEEQNDSGQLEFFDPKFWFAQTNMTIRIKSEVAFTASLNLKWQLGGPKLIS